jgi:putative thioredoxin
METIIGQNTGGGAQPGGRADITTADANSFTKEVVEASDSKPVIVNFYSPRDGSEATVGKALEQAVQGTNGAVKLVKVDVDQNQALAQQLRLQSLPTIYAFYQRQPVDGFAGSQATQQQVQQFVQQVQQVAGGGQGQQDMQQQLAQVLEQAKGALDAGEVGTAQQIYGQVLQYDEQNATALAGLIRCHIANQDPQGAREIYEGLTEELQQNGEIEAAKAAIDLAEESAKARGDVEQLEAQVAETPDDLQARFDLAIALNASGRREEACDQLLEIIRRNREWNEDAARKQLVKFFEAWGPTDPVTLSARRRLSSILFS